MQIRFIGAAGGSVTGSCTHFHYPRTDTSFLVDCGLVQGEGDFESINGAAFPFDASAIEFVLLTHAHLDHCGLLPKLYRAGFSGEVICTAATAKLARLSLTDSARYPKSLFSTDEVERIRFKPIEDQPATAKPAMFSVGKDLIAGFRRTAHIIGACSVTIGWLDEQDRKRYVVMSGDLGNNVKDNLYQPLLAHRRSVFAYPDAIIVESTYGGRTRSQEHKSFDARIEALRGLLQREVFDRKALLVVPAFALQRTHEILLDLVVVLQRYFATTATSTSPYLAPSRFWENFNSDRWTTVAHEAFLRAVQDLPTDQQQGWDDVFEPTGEKPYIYRLKPGHAKSIDELRTLVETQRAPYPVDVILDSGLARSMGAILREELLRRSVHKPDEPAHRNPEMSARLGCTSEDELEAMLKQLMPDPDGDVPPIRIGPHTIRFQKDADVPSRAQCETRGAILLTGGGMCDGGPVVAHLQTLARAKRECVLVKTGYMARYSLGERLTQLAAGNEPDQSKPDGRITIGSLNDVANADVTLRTADFSAFYSGHADQAGLVDFVCSADGRVREGAQPAGATVFINHGSTVSRQALKEAIELRSRAGQEGDRPILAIELPESDRQSFDLAVGQWVTVDTRQTVEQLLLALLREQSRTNELLRQLVQSHARSPSPISTIKTKKKA